MAKASMTSIPAGGTPPKPGADPDDRRGLPLTASLLVLCLAANTTWVWAFSGVVVIPLLWATFLPVCIGVIAVRRGLPAAAVPPISVLVFLPLAAWSCFASPGAVGSVFRSFPTMLRRTFDLALPLDVSGEPLLLAVSAWWLVAALCVEFGLRARRRFLTLAVALGGAIGGVLTSTPLGRPSLSSVVFGIAAAGFLIGSAWSRSVGTSGHAVLRGWLSSGWVRTAASLIVIAIVAAVAGGGETSKSRPELHRSVPFDPTELLSPIALLTRDLATNPPEPRFELTHLHGEPADRVVVGTVADFDGVDWRVTDQFRAIGQVAPEDPRREAVDRSTVRLRLTGYDGGWVPHVGHLQELHVADPPTKVPLVGNDDRSSIATRHVLEEGTVIVATGTTLRNRDTATVTGPVGSPSPVPGDEYLRLPSQVAAPPGSEGASQHRGGCRLESILALGREWSAGAGGGLEGVEAQRAMLTTIEAQIRSRFSVDHTFAEGMSIAALCKALGVGVGETAPANGSRSAARSEQYASAMALMGRELGIPTRVVVGYRVPSSRGEAVEISSAHAHAWVEAFLGPKQWVTFDPTPVSSGTAEDQQRTVDPRQPTPPPDVSTSVPEVAPSTTTTQPPATVPTHSSGIDAVDGGWSVQAVAGVSSAGLLALLGLVVGTVTLLKLRRRRRRRNAMGTNSRVIGAWREATDRIRDERIYLRPSWTSREVAHEVRTAADNEAVGSVLVELGDISTRARYSSLVADEFDVERAWDLLEQLETEFDSKRGLIARLKCRIRPHSLVNR